VQKPPSYSHRHSAQPGNLHRTVKAASLLPTRAGALQSVAARRSRPRLLAGSPHPGTRIAESNLASLHHVVGPILDFPRRYALPTGQPLPLHFSTLQAQKCGKQGTYPAPGQGLAPICTFSTFIIWPFWPLTRMNIGWKRLGRGVLHLLPPFL
jgi:hypothetical protein